MTLTLVGPAPSTDTTLEPHDVSRPTTGPALVALLREIVASCTELDPDLLHSTRPAGQAVLRIAAAARAHAATRGLDAGAPLSTAPGIVVMRDLVQVLRLLESAAAADAVPVGLEAALSGELPGGLAVAYAMFVETVGRQA